MATEYELDMATDLKTVQALELLSRHISGLALTWNGKDSDYLLGSTIEIDINEPFRSWQQTLTKGFGFTPTLSVGFRFKNNTDFDTFSETMFQATMFLLQHAKDAVLLSNYETTIMRRLGEQLIFNSNHQTWDDHWLKTHLATTPFECRPLPSPLLYS
ncbi:SitI3 family protein [Archangium sp.]|uniref:SitI3 family protein n=1 Tax=Archangium sp. TaxID=1872627 RepID=UPI00286C854F|nr:SitI3 family protein [Archangium sp.]